VSCRPLDYGNRKCPATELAATISCNEQVMAVGGNKLLTTGNMSGIVTAVHKGTGKPCDEDTVGLSPELILALLRDADDSSWYTGLLISKYRASPIYNSHYFSNIDSVIADTFEKILIKYPQYFWLEISIPNYQYIVKGKS